MATSKVIEEKISSKVRLGFSLTPEAARLLRALAVKRGHSQTAVVESAIRDLASKDGVQ